MNQSSNRILNRALYLETINSDNYPKKVSLICRRKNRVCKEHNLYLFSANK